MTTDDRQRIQALLDERAELIAQRDRCATDLATALAALQQIAEVANTVDGSQTGGSIFDIASAAIASIEAP
jgi:uncharacterized protein